jgi:cardiolipin synthase
MFLDDFSRSREVRAADFTSKPWWFRLAARTCRLMAPVQ